MFSTRTATSGSIFISVNDNDKNEIVKISRGSTGQELTVAYSFFNQLLKRSNHTMPIVVDHPVVALDTLRREMTAKTISEFMAKAEFVRVSPMSLGENGAHGTIL